MFNAYHMFTRQFLRTKPLRRDVPSKYMMIHLSVMCQVNIRDIFSCVDTRSILYRKALFPNNRSISAFSL